MRDASPLRYPGGKWRFSGYFEQLIKLNYSTPPTYVEPFAGGASLALSLLFSGAVSEIYLNDLDPAIHAFWYSVLNDTDKLCRRIRSIPVNPVQWKKQKQLYSDANQRNRIQLAFSLFFLNRTNHSGILNGGMIGGKEQKGDWKIDARFNRSELIRRIRRIAKYKRKIHLSRKDAVKFLTKATFSKNCLVYLDPPYFHAGRELYLNAYEPKDHKKVRDCTERLRRPWIISYDDVLEIRKLYAAHRSRKATLWHTARTTRLGREVLFFSQHLKIPSLFKQTS
jgi:DNA adenine methylase